MTLAWQRLADSQTLQITNQAKGRKKEGPVLCIAVSGYSYDLNCQQCDYKVLCQSHMRKHVKNVHEGLKYDCTSCDYNSGDRLERSIYQRKI